MGHFPPQTSPLVPLGGYPWFLPGGKQGFFGSWGSNGNVACTKFAPQGTQLPLASLQSSLGVIPFATWRYFQVADFLHKLQPQLWSFDILTSFESLCINLPDPKHLLSQMYKLVLGSQYLTVPYYIWEHEKELGQEFTPSQVQRVFKFMHSTSVSSHIHDFSYKCIIRWYSIPSSSNVSDSGCQMLERMWTGHFSLFMVVLSQD